MKASRHFRALHDKELGDLYRSPRVGIKPLRRMADWMKIGCGSSGFDEAMKGPASG